MGKDLKSWKDMTDAGLIPEGGTAKDYNTGTWRTVGPEVDFKKCVHCLLCWWYCPDSAIQVKDTKIERINYEHCKGCGICAEVCPPKVKAIAMIENESLIEKQALAGSAKNE